MPPLLTDVRSNLDKAIICARDAAENAARAALATLAVERDAPFASMTEDQRRLRRALRAKARQLGSGDFLAGIPLLIEEIAYQQWHRMLFARFLAENDLLMHPEVVSVSLQDCADLAPEEGAADGWELAARYASRMLPGIFLTDDPVVQLRLAPEGRHALERILDEQPALVFTSDDALGWVYQFWQSRRKEEVNASEEKIGAGTIGPVTQLFTEDYMVKFLLHNSLGAWWAARHPASPLIESFTYLRFLEDGTPAAGTFPGWPERAADVTVMDPCGGSGHFIVAAFEMLYRMRMAEEGLSPAEASKLTIRDNIFMLEIDARCTQIAGFNLLLATWKASGYRKLPVPNIACSGIALEGQLQDWLKLAGDDDRLRHSLERLYHLFRNAPTLGSLIDPARVPANERMFIADYNQVEPLLERALTRESETGDPGAAVLGYAVKGAAHAAQLLAKRYTLVATNVPYLTRGKQGMILREFCQNHYPEGTSDLATAFFDRCLVLCVDDGTTSIVLPQNWLFLTTYKGFREKLLKTGTLHLLARLGEGGFDSPAAAGAFAILVIVSRASASANHLVYSLDVSEPRSSAEKGIHLLSIAPTCIAQNEQLEHPDSRITLDEVELGCTLSDQVSSSSGMTAGDRHRFYCLFWEVSTLGSSWEFSLSSVDQTLCYGGRSYIVFYQQGHGEMRHLAESVRHLNHVAQNWQRGQDLWGQTGIAIRPIRALPATLYLGEKFDNNVMVLCPSDSSDLLALWALCSSPEYNRTVRKFNKKISVDPSYLADIPVDLRHWQKVALEQYPQGLPDPWSNDPTQWLFNGYPTGSTDPLQVAVARLLGYRWPGTPHVSHGDSTDRLNRFTDCDGIACLSAVVGEQPAAERLRALLAHAYTHPPQLPDFERYRVGDFVPTTPVDPYGGWSVAVQQRLLAEAGYGGKSLADWLRDGFFKQHCKLFQNRPFIWHIWDGLRDGFSALVNYHRLDAAALDKLIYTYLGAWIADQRAERDGGVAGADGRLVAALQLQKKLEAIRDGEPPYDIFVRWKPLREQPIGWNPDLNDGVRLNIRPFVEAGVLRSKFTVNWNKDRGKNPDGSERINDLHFTRKEKLAARARAGV